MREIKFRGKRIDNGEWLEGGYYGKKMHPFTGDDQHYIMSATYTPISDSSYFTDFEVDPATVGQDTGLKDESGQEICEGDICTYHNGLSDYYYVVEWVFAGLQVVTYKKPEANVRGISDGINQGYMEDADGFEVIGNIHDNPELLE